MNSLVQIAGVLVAIAALSSGRETTILESNGDSLFGSWGESEYCPDGSFVTGFMIKQEGPQGGGDDTATNAVRLLCDDVSGTSLTSTEGPWGNWISRQTCSNGRRFWGFRLKMERNQHFRDDTGVNGVEFICGGGQTLDFPGSWGSWRSWNYCPVGHGICGIRTKVEGEKMLGFSTDNVAMSDIEVYCCPMACTQSDCAKKAPE